MGHGEDLAPLNKLLARPMRRWWVRVGVWWLLALLLVQLAWFFYEITLPGKPLNSIIVRLTIFSSPVFTLALAMLAYIVYALWLLSAVQCYRLSLGLFRNTAAPVPPRLAERCFWICMAQGMLLIAICTISWVVARALESWANSHLSAAAAQAGTIYSETSSWPYMLTVFISDSFSLITYACWIVALLVICGSELPSWIWLLSMPAYAAISFLTYRLPDVKVPDWLGSCFIDWVLPYGWVVGLLIIAALFISAVRQRPRLVLLFASLIAATTLLQVVKFSASTVPLGTHLPVATTTVSSTYIYQAYQAPPVFFNLADMENQPSDAPKYELQSSWGWQQPGFRVGAWGAFVAIAINALWLALNLLLMRWAIRARYREKASPPAAAEPA